MTSFFAHSANASGDWHDLPTHLRDVAEKGRTFATKFGNRAGLWYDLGLGR
jgi:hypothetical protein